MSKILLFYKYVDVEYPEAVLSWQKELCQSLNLKGRIIIASEGINGTLGGSDIEIEAYKSQMNNNSKFKDLFSGIDFKESFSDKSCFSKLKIVVKKEIVRLGLDPDIIKAKDGGKHLTPEQAHSLITQNPEDLVLLDTRNNYESRIGTFVLNNGQSAIASDTNTFREFPKYIDENLEKFKDKQVLMFCTGGVRCERASAYLKSKNVSKNVYQIEGGIHRYAQKYADGYFRGKNYVFDSRIASQVNDDILSECDYCKEPYDNYSNCINAECNIQIIVCPNCMETYHNTCSDRCLDLVLNKKVNIRKLNLLN